MVGGERYPMTSVLPVDFVLEKRPQAHGYTILKSSALSTYLEKGVAIRGHEFHYSRVCRIDGNPFMAYHVERGSGIDGMGDGIIYKNVVASYTHIHALATPQWAPALVRIARKYQSNMVGQRGQGKL